MELVQQQRLIRFRLGVARHDQPSAVGGGQTHIQHLNRRQLFQHRPRREARGQDLQPLFQRHRKSVGQEGHEEVSFHALLQLMIDRTQSQFAFEGFEGRLNLGELDVAFPQHRGVFTH